MNKNTVPCKAPKFSSHLRRYIFVFVIWSLFIGLSLAWNIYQVHENTLSTASAAARVSIHKDISFRKWANSHGGVYVPPTENIPPNPYLKIPNRDVVTTTGIRLTLMNPAYILRDMQSNFDNDYGSRSHLTSLKPINPSNIADAWETKALLSFEQGNGELLEVQKIDTQPFLRLMQPFIVDEGCLKCHAEQGYKLGDIRGGISTSVSLASYLKQEQHRNAELALSHGLIWLIGMLGQGLAYRHEVGLNARRRQAEDELARYRNHLEDLVMQRTSELEHAKNLAEDANRAKSMFLASMSHELRTPLNAVLGFSELMSLDAMATTTQKETLGIINRSGAHLLSMINDVLDISKIEAGRLELDIQAIDLIKLLQDIGEMINVRAANKQLSFSLEIAADMPRFVNADSGKLRQIFINLLGNAIKFTKHGTIILRTDSYPLSVVQSMLSVEVIDSGVGIPADKLHELFQPFVQLTQENADIKGTGLGLAISKSLVELMGGTISVSSGLGKGSIFKIELPVNLANDDEIAVEEHCRVVKGLAPNQPNWRILIVDDNTDNRLLLVATLNNMGFQIRQAENGQVAIDIFKAWQPHLIWMDMRMPVMDGYEATIKIRQLAGGDKVKIIALTASVFIEQHKNIIKAGCDAVLYKPFHVPEIFAALIKYLGVKFIYQNLEVIAPLSTTEITTEMVATLPLELRQQLHHAALKLDMEEIDTIVEQIHIISPEIANDLNALVKGFQFEQIIQLTESH